MVSGALILHTHKLSSQFEMLTANSIKIESKAATHKPHNKHASLSCQHQDTMLQQQLDDIYQVIAALESQIVVATDDKNSIVDEHQQQQQMQQQQAATQLVSNAVANGYWSHNDAEMFRNHAVELSPKTMEKIAAQVIRGMENGTLQTPDDMMLPF